MGNVIEISKENRQRNKRQQTQNDDGWINYPPTVITVGYSITIVKRWIMIFVNAPPYSYGKIMIDRFRRC